MKRRSFLTLSAAAASGAGAQVKTVRIPLRFFTQQEALAMAAAAARIFPADESGPGAKEAGVAIYIDRQLAGPYGRDRYRYTQPPFEEGLPEQGYQGKASPREVYREGLKLLAGFEALDPEAQDDRLERIEKTRFFQLLRQHTIEGMFCDPMHGGNKDLVGWRLIGFPGPHMSWRDDIDRHYGQAFRPKPMSLSQILERPVKPWEDSE